LLPRACLPLAYLDPTGDAEDQVGSRLFAARVEILEDVEKEDQQPRVLIADSVVDGRLHAIERVQIGLYALCKLCAWVDLYALEGLNALLVKHGPQKRKAVQGQSTMSQGEWWRPAATSLDIVDKSNEGSIPGITKPLGARLCLQRPVQDDRPPSPAIPEVIRPITPKPVEYLLDGSMEQPPQEPEDIYSMIRLQYQEALYASKVRLSCYLGPIYVADYSLRHLWHTLQRDRYLGLEQPSTHVMLLPTATRSLFSIYERTYWSWRRWISSIVRLCLV